MKVYHASSVIVKHPDTAHSCPYLDFGAGFYVTTLENKLSTMANVLSDVGVKHGSITMKCVMNLADGRF